MSRSAAADAGGPFCARSRGRHSARACPAKGDRPAAAPPQGVVSTLCEYANANPEGVLLALGAGDTVVFEGEGYRVSVR